MTCGGLVSGSEWVARTYSLEHTFTIHNFTHIAATLPTEKKVRSGLFGSTADDPECQFYVNVYPNGSRAKFAGHLGLFLHIAPRLDARSYEGAVKLDGLVRYCQARFSIKDSRGKDLAVRSASHLLRVRRGGTWGEGLSVDGGSGGSGGEKDNWGFRRFRRSEEAAELAGGHGGSLILCVTVRVLIPDALMNAPLRIITVEEEGRTMWAKGLETLLKEGKGADVRLRVERGMEAEEAAGGGGGSESIEWEESATTFAVHKCILAAQSEFFAALFRSGMGAGEKGPSAAMDSEGGAEGEKAPLEDSCSEESDIPVMVLKGVSGNAFGLMLEWVYTGRLPALPDTPDPAIPLTELLRCADMYRVEGLVGVVETRLAMALRAENVVEVCARLGPLSSPALQPRIAALLASCPRKIINSKEFSDLAEKAPRQALAALTYALVASAPTPDL